MKRRRILVVVQRYGAEVLGGSESHARAAAERLARWNEVEVATTTALDHWTWAAHYPVGTSELNGVRIHRFPIAAGRRADYKALEHTVLLEDHSLEDEWTWLRAQGPDAPELLEFVHRAGPDYQAVIFYTYIYPPTALGLPLVPERAALVPTAHDELPLRLVPFRALFQLPRAFGFLTAEERAIVHERFRNGHISDEILGIGLDPPPHREAGFFREHAPRGPVALYLGQVTEAKAVHELIDAWTAYRGSGGEALLALAGEVRMALPERDDLVVLGRVSEREKWAALASADVLVLPSHVESLGIVLLEAWQVGTPVLVPAWNAVTSGQVTRTGGGLTYGSREEFAAHLATLATEGREIGERGRQWVERECSWQAFDERLRRLVDMAAFDA